MKQQAIGYALLAVAVGIPILSLARYEIPRFFGLVAYHPSEKHTLTPFEAAREVQEGIYERACVIYGPKYVGTGQVSVTWTANNVDDIIVEPSDVTNSMALFTTYTNQKAQLRFLITNAQHSWIATNVMGTNTNITAFLNARAFTLTTNDIRLVETQLLDNVGLATNGSWWTEYVTMGLMTSPKAYRVMDDILYEMIWSYSLGRIECDTTRITNDTAISATNHIGGLYLQDSYTTCDVSQLCVEYRADWDWDNKYNHHCQAAGGCYIPSTPDQWVDVHATRILDYTIYRMYVQREESTVAGCHDDCSTVGTPSGPPVTTNFVMYCAQLDANPPNNTGNLCDETDPNDCDPPPFAGFTNALGGTDTYVVDSESDACQFLVFSNAWSATATVSSACNTNVQSLSWEVSRQMWPIYFPIQCSNSFNGAEDISFAGTEFYLGSVTNPCAAQDPPNIGNFATESYMTGSVASNAWTNYFASPVTVTGTDRYYQTDWVNTPSSTNIPYGTCPTPANSNDVNEGWAIVDAILFCDWCSGGFVFCDTNTAKVADAL